MYVALVATRSCKYLQLKFTYFLVILLLLLLFFSSLLNRHCSNVVNVVGGVYVNFVVAVFVAVIVVSIVVVWLAAC